MPGIEKVIEIHEQVLAVSNAPAAIIGGLIWVFLTIAFVIYLSKEKKNFSLQEWIFNGVFLVIVLLILGGLSFTIKDYDFSINEKQWKENYLNPYLKGLPENKEYVEDFSQIVTEEKDTIKSIYINEKEKPITVEIFALNKESETTKKISVQVLLQKDPINKPYLTYKTIEKNISTEYTTEQHYETILHIPEEYKVIAPTK